MKRKQGRSGSACVIHGKGFQWEWDGGIKRKGATIGKHDEEKQDAT